MVPLNIIDLQTTALLPGIFLFWLGGGGGVQATNGKLKPWNGPKVHKAFSFNTCGFCLHLQGVAYIVRPHLDYWTYALQAAMNCYQQSWNSVQVEADYRFLYLYLLSLPEGHLVLQQKLLRIYSLLTSAVW